MNRLVQELSPGGRFIGTRRLRGGLGSRMHCLILESASGERRRLVLRRYVAGWRNSGSADALQEFRVLQLAESVGIPAPRPVLLDAECRHFEAPCMVLSYLPGRSFHAPRNAWAWAVEIAKALASVHAVRPDDLDLSWLPRHEAPAIRENIEGSRQRAEETGPLAIEILVELEKRLASIELSAPCLIHADFHPGNVVFSRGKITGIVDWSEARLGDPRFDVAQCRLDLVLSHGVALADHFRQAYEAVTHESLGDLSFFDLERGLPALLHYKRWLVGYHDAGLTRLTEAVAGERLRSFLSSALHRARGEQPDENTRLTGYSIYAD